MADNEQKQPDPSDTDLIGLLRRIMELQTGLRERIEVLEARSKLQEEITEKCRISTDANSASIQKLVRAVEAAAHPEPPKAPPPATGAVN